MEQSTAQTDLLSAERTGRAVTHLAGGVSGSPLRSHIPHAFVKTPRVVFLTAATEQARRQTYPLRRGRTCAGQSHWPASTSLCQLCPDNVSAPPREGHTGAWRWRQELRNLLAGQLCLPWLRWGALGGPASPPVCPVAVLWLVPWPVGCKVALGPHWQGGWGSRKVQ